MKHLFNVVMYASCMRHVIWFYNILFLLSVSCKSCKSCKKWFHVIGGERERYRDEGVFSFPPIYRKFLRKSMTCMTCMTLTNKSDPYKSAMHDGSMTYMTRTRASPKGPR